MTVGNQAQSDEKNVKSIEKALNILLLFSPRNSRPLPYRYCQDDGVEHCHHIPASEHPSKQGLFDPRPIYRTVHIRWCFVLFGTDCKKKCRISARFVHLFWNGFGMKRRRRLISLSVKGSSGYVSRKPEGTQSIQPVNEIRDPRASVLWRTGIVLLAFQKPEELGQSLAAMKDYCKDVNLQQLLMKIAITKDQGYCLKKGDSDGTHVGCIAAPIYNADGSVTSCLGISTPEFRFPDDPSYFVSLIKQGAKEISQQLGYHGDLE